MSGGVLKAGRQALGLPVQTLTPGTGRTPRATPGNRSLSSPHRPGPPFAIAAHADEREAHLREVERSGRSLPEGSYGRRNRQAIAARETRVATRLRAVEQAYRTATERGTAYTPPEPTRTLRSPGLQAGRQIELEAEP